MKASVTAVTVVSC